MTIRNQFSLIAVTALLISIAVIFFVKKKSHEGEKFMYAVPVKTESGWGYKIFLGTEEIKDTSTDRIYIRQDYIPGKPGKQAFTSEADALRVANLVILKIGSGLMPTITLPELDSLGIITK
jgi:Domain of unknown function (DUF4907)